MSKYSDNATEKFQWMVNDPFYSSTYDERVVVSDFCEVVSEETHMILDTLTDKNFEDIYNDWYEFTSQDWRTGENKPPQPY